MAHQTLSDVQIQNQLPQLDEIASSLSAGTIKEVDIPEDFKDFTTPSSWAVLKLPRFILLKGDNGKYLRSRRNVNNDPTNEFTADKNMDATVFEVVTLADGAVGIRSTFYNMFLGSDATGGIQALYTLAELEDLWNARFWPVNLGRGNASNLIGLRLFRSQILESRCYRAEGTSTLSSSNMPLTKRMGFEMEEPVSQRQIYGVQYRMEQAKIYDHEPLTSVTKDVKNWSNSPQKGVLSFSHTESESQTWGSTDSWKVSGSVGLTVRVPFVKETSITTEAYYAGSYEWGEAQETAKEIGTQLEVEVPPKSMVQATMIVQKGKLEVPFSYGQRDILYNGDSSLVNFPDGLFTGVNNYVTFQTIKRSLA